MSLLNAQTITNSIINTSSSNLTIQVLGTITLDQLIIENNSIEFQGLQVNLACAQKLSFKMTESNRYYYDTDLPKFKTCTPTSTIIDSGIEPVTVNITIDSNRDRSEVSQVTITNSSGDSETSYGVDAKSLYDIINDYNGFPFNLGPGETKVDIVYASDKTESPVLQVLIVILGLAIAIFTLSYAYLHLKDVYTEISALDFTKYAITVLIILIFDTILMVFISQLV